MAHILLAEDDEGLRVFLARGLRRAGHDVDAVGDGEAALALAREHAYELLLADVVMPGLDGVEVARRITARRPAIRVMFITGFAAVALGATGFGANRPMVLPKPFHLRRLIEEVETLLAR